MNYLKIHIKSFLFVLFFILVGLSTSANVKFKATLDSASLLMGNQTIIHVEIQQDATQNGKIINEPEKTSDITELTKGIEFIRIVRNDTTIIDGNKKQINRDYLIQSFDSGAYLIPPFKYVIGVDTFSTNELSLKVFPVKLDSAERATQQLINFAPIEEVNTKWHDSIPDWVIDYWKIWLIVIVVILSLITIYILYRKNKKISHAKVVIPPYELAMQKLLRLKSQRLCANGHEKEYYTLLIDILREYLDGRFGINAIEMTTTQILKALDSNIEVADKKDRLKEVLDIADFVKFAKVLPTSEENVKAFNDVESFVELTKPIQVELQDSELTNNKNKINKKK